RQVRPPIVVHEAHVGPGGDVRERAMAVFVQVEDDAIDLDPDDRVAPAPDGREDVASAPDANDGDVAALPDEVGQCRDVVADPLERLASAVPLGDGRTCFAIDHEPGDVRPE